MSLTTSSTEEVLFEKIIPFLTFQNFQTVVSQISMRPVSCNRGRRIEIIKKGYDGFGQDNFRSRIVSVEMRSSPSKINGNFHYSTFIVNTWYKYSFLKYVTLIKHLYNKIIVMILSFILRNGKELYSFEPYNPHSLVSILLQLLQPSKHVFFLQYCFS